METSTEVLSVTAHSGRDEGTTLLLPDEELFAAQHQEEDVGSIPTTSAPPVALSVVKLQAYCGICSQVLSFFGVALVTRWVSQLGGLSWRQGTSKTTFNWHPLLMITAFFFMTIAALSFRTQALFRRHRLVDRRHVKLVHALTWVAASLCALVALFAVFRSHNDPSNLIANLYSFHSWVGLTVVLLYLAQLFGSWLVFYDCIQLHPSTEASVLTVHKIVGPTVYLGTAATILLGIQEKEGFVGCSYTVTEPDILPFRNVGKLPSACWTSHALGLLILLVAVLTSCAWYNVEDRRSR